MVEVVNFPSKTNGPKKVVLNVHFSSGNVEPMEADKHIGYIDNGMLAFGDVDKDQEMDIKYIVNPEKVEFIKIEEVVTDTTSNQHTDN